MDINHLGQVRPIKEKYQINTRYIKIHVLCEMAKIMVQL